MAATTVEERGELKGERALRVGVVMDRDPNASSQFVKALNNL
jgi:hypothetical protein